MIPPLLLGWDLLLAAGEWGSRGCSFWFSLVGGRCGPWWVVNCLFWWGHLRVVLSAEPGQGLLPTVVGSVVSCPSKPWSLWLPPPALLVRGLPLVLIAVACTLSGCPGSVRDPVGGGPPLPQGNVFSGQEAVRLILDLNIPKRRWRSLNHSATAFTSAVQHVVENRADYSSYGLSFHSVLP